MNKLDILGIRTRDRIEYKDTEHFSLIIPVKLCFFAVLINFLLSPVLLLAEKPKSSVAFKALNARYLKLRNTDIEIADISAWEKVSEDFDTFVEKAPTDPNAARALFNSALVSEQFYRRYGGDDRLRKSSERLETLASKYSESDLADDALIRKGDLELYDLNDVSAARVTYTRVRDGFPRSDMQEVAKSRLRSLENGEYAAYIAAAKANAAQGGAPGKNGKKLVVLDPGHGGEDEGARGQGGLLEKDVTLAVALELEKLLTSKLGVAVRLTRRKDEFVPLKNRTQYANDYEADLFISLHTNASPQGTLSGFQTFYLDNTGDAASRLLADRENKVDKDSAEQAPDDLEFMLSDLIQNAKLEDSILLAHTVHRSLINFTRARWDSIRDVGVKKAPFYVLVGAHMPCVLAELSFIDNAVDGKLLSQKDFRQDLAYGLYIGIKKFLEHKT